MSPVRRLSAALTLVAFLGGGLVAPALHRAAHGIEHAQARHDAATQTDHVHTDGPGLTVPLNGVDVPHDLCVLCLPKQHTGPTLSVLPSPAWTDRQLIPQRPIAPATSALALLPIRGPPIV